ncbi:MAG: DEAD/DEAH box helicase [Spirochaetales bacterium]|nr:DEAD/DEAH box helicase [Spirochaetales bacterium]
MSQTPSQTQTDFASLGLADGLLAALREEGYQTPTPIQARAIPPLLEGRDLLGIARTGTGKTAAFALPIIQHLSARPIEKRAQFSVRALVVAPTRELAAQIDESFKAYGRKYPLTHAVVFGGVGKNPQIQAVWRGIDVLVATPGRLLDLMSEGKIRLDRVEIAVLDEADRMLDMGFVRDVRKIVAKLPAERQTMLFSATMPGDIAELASGILRDPVRVSIDTERPAAEKVHQRIVHVARSGKREALSRLIFDHEIERAVVFTRTKHGANRLAKQLGEDGIGAAAIHANKSQSARIRALADFKAGSVKVLVATDLAARGIDVDGITHVVNFDLPNEPETYVHRIGRTARAGASGQAVSFCDPDEKPLLRAIEKLIGERLPFEGDPNLPLGEPEKDDRGPRPVRGRQGGRGVPAGRPAARPASAANGRFGERSGAPQRVERPVAAGGGRDFLRDGGRGDGRRRDDNRGDGFRNEGSPRLPARSEGERSGRSAQGSRSGEASRRFPRAASRANSRG